MLFEWWERYRRIILSAGTLLFIGSSIWLYLIQQSDAASGLPLETPAFAAQKSPASEESQPSKKPPAEQKEPKQEPVYLWVDVKGKVKKPGLYHFEQGKRVADAIASAGGALPEADLEQINLAQTLTDGSAVVIPPKGIAPGMSSASSLSSGIAGPSGMAGTSGIAGPADDKTVNINTASLEELMTLPGIGEARAKAILSYRTEKNAFRSPDELMQIGGIGEKMYARIKDLVRVQ